MQKNRKAKLIEGSLEAMGTLDDGIGRGFQKPQF